jgi:aminocarboxymuconate-semialdehyde decarboxylase
MPTTDAGDGELTAPHRPVASELASDQASDQESTESAEAVDMHGHGVPESFLKEIASRGDGVCGVTAARDGDDWHVRMPAAPVVRVVRAGMRDAERRRKWLAEQRIGVQVLSPWLDVQSSPGMTADVSRDWARRLNEAMLAESEAAGGCHPVLASVALHRPERAAEDLVQAVSSQGMAGLILNTHPPERDLADAELEPLWSAAEQLGIPVVLHPPTEGPHSAIPGAAAYGNAFGRLIDSTLVLASLVLGGLLDRHPDLALVAVHGGGFLPYQAKRLDGASRIGPLADLTPERGSPSEYLTSLYFDTVSLSASAIRFLTEVAGADRVLLGTDYPFPLGDRTPVQTVHDAGLSPADTRQVLHGNSANLLGGRNRA